MIGIRAHDIGRLPAEKLAHEIAKKGFNCAHLALSKAIDGIETGYGKLNPGLAKYVRNAFSRNGIEIAVLGCYINPIHPDEATRRESLDRFKEHIRFARDFGCSIVATETGSFNADCSYHPDSTTGKGFEAIVRSVDELVEEAEKFGVIVCIEGVTTHTVATPLIMRRVLDAVPSNNLQVLFDLANILNAGNTAKQDEIIEESFELFGDRIQAVHAKDFIIEGGGKKAVKIGTGIINFSLLMRKLKEYKPMVEILLEDTKPEDMIHAREFIRSFS